MPCVNTPRENICACLLAATGSYFHILRPVFLHQMP